MQWSGRRESGNVEDRRGLSTGGMVAGGGLGSIVLIVLALLFGVDPSGLLPQGGSEPGSEPAARRAANPSEEELVSFTKVVLADTEDVWNELFRSQFKKDYPEPTLVFFTGGTRSGCGAASSATGPFYCPADQKVYIDLQFFNEMATRFRAAGDFAQAYVVAHEIGHHVQNQLGLLDQVHSKQGRVSKAEYNQLSVRSELQADFLAGVWAHYEQKMKNVVETGDVEEALNAANAIGDDRLQKQAQGYVVPDSFTHGTSAQRARWFRLGFETGDLSRMMDLFKLPYNQI
jgi:predicted metalloprotease